jgi:glycosyltransferase involved in cell wall biosynthesis
MNDHAYPFTARADLHVHSRYSDRPSEWVLRRIGAPECFIEPMHVYQRAMEAGMNFVTISDHNKIDGALEIAHLPNTFISDEITTYFPENGAKMHVLAIGITESQFRDIQQLRENIYELRDYFVANDIIYSVAHPLFLVNSRLTVEQYEKLLVLFNRFERINGTRDPRAGTVVEAVLNTLTPEMIEKLADKHGITPIGPTPHRKLLTGGSDDHSGMYVSSAHTVTPEAGTVAEFLGHLRAGRHEPAGRSGNTVHLAHCFYHIAYHYVKDKFIGQASGGTSLLGEMLKRLLEPQAARVPASRGIRGRVEQWVWKRRKQRMSESERMLVDEFSKFFKQNNAAAPALPASDGSGSFNASPAPVGPTATQAFESSCRLVHQLGYAFFTRFTEKARSGDLVKCLEAVAALGPVAAATMPYVAAFGTQHKDERFIQQVTEHFGLPELTKRSERRAWLTDTFEDVNGVTRTIRTLAETAYQQGRPISVLTSVAHPLAVDFDHVNFEPIGECGLPEYPQQKISFPPFLKILEYIERQQFSELIISTPGPMGLVGLAAAKLMHLRTVGIYHTDFPQYIHTLTDDRNMEALTWRYMYWFFNQCDTILVPSDYYRRYLIEHEFEPDKIRVLRRGIDTSKFGTTWRDENFWMPYGGKAGATTLLYVGRVSSEKNVGMMVDAFERMSGERENVQLAIVGEGPLHDQLKHRCRRNDRVLFTGWLSGEELSRAYASAELFVFPSTTDTFGNVVLEAQVSGLPAIVSDRGGPQEIIDPDRSGLVVELSETEGVDRLAGAMARLVADADLRASMASAALEVAARYTWPAVLDVLLGAAEPAVAAPRPHRQSLAAPV